MNVITEINDLFKQGILYFSIFLGFIVLHFFLNALLTSKVPRNFCLRQIGLFPKYEIYLGCQVVSAVIVIPALQSVNICSVAARKVQHIILLFNPLYRSFIYFASLITNPKVPGDNCVLCIF